MAMLYRIVLALGLLLLVSVAAVRMTHGEVPTDADFVDCNREAPEAVRTGAASPTTADTARAETVRSPGFMSKVIESSDPQIHGMEAEGAKDATYQAAYRGCMRRKGF